MTDRGRFQDALRYLLPAGLTACGPAPCS